MLITLMDGCAWYVAAKQKPKLKVSKVLAWLVKLHLGIDWPVCFLIDLTQKGVPFEVAHA